MLETINFFTGFHTCILLVELIFCWHKKRRSWFWLRLIPLAALYLYLPELMGGYFASYLTVGWFTFGFFLVVLASAGLLWLCFELDWKEILFYCCVAHTVQHTTHCLANILWYCGKWNGTVFAASHFVIILGALVLCWYLRKKKLVEDADIQRGTLLLFACVSSVVVYCLSLWTSSQESRTLGMFIFDTFCCVELMIILFDSFRLRKLKTEQLVMLHILRQEQAQHELAKANIEVINRKCHDLKHQVSALRRMDDQEEKERTLQELEQAVLIYDRFAKTGNDDLDIVLTEKGLLCEQRSISLQCMADGSKLSFLEPTDIYSLFGNALDNAIESVSKVENPNRRLITMNVAPKGNCLIIHMENVCEQEPAFENGLPVTTKADPTCHGFGMQSMRFIAQKYDGALSARWEEGLFILDILFMIP